MVNLVSSLFSFIVHPCLIPVLFYVVISALLQFHSCFIPDLLLFHSCFIRGSLLFYSWSISVPFLSYISCSTPVLFLVRACCIRGSFVLDSCFIRVSFAFHSWFVRVSFVFHSVRVERSRPGLVCCYYCVLGYPAALSLLHIFYTTPPMCLTYPFSPVTEMQSVFLFIWDTEFHFSIQTLILSTCPQSSSSGSHTCIVCQQWHLIRQSFGWKDWIYWNTKTLATLAELKETSLTSQYGGSLCDVTTWRISPQFSTPILLFCPITIQLVHLL